MHAQGSYLRVVSSKMTSSSSRSDHLIMTPTPKRQRLSPSASANSSENSTGLIQISRKFINNPGLSDSDQVPVISTSVFETPTRSRSKVDETLYPNSSLFANPGAEGFCYNKKTEYQSHYNNETNSETENNSKIGDRENRIIQNLPSSHYPYHNQILESFLQSEKVSSRKSPTPALSDQNFKFYSNLRYCNQQPVYPPIHPKFHIANSSQASSSLQCLNQLNVEENYLCKDFRSKFLTRTKKPLAFKGDHPSFTIPLLSLNVTKSYREALSIMESIRQSASMIEPYSKERNVWTTETLCAFDEAIRTIPRLGRTKLLALTPEGRKPFGRNELIADYIYRRTGIERDRKQVSSHIQVIKNAKKVDPMLAELLGPADEGANLCFNEHTASWFGACITNEALTLYACTPEFPFPSQALLHLPPYQDEEEYSDFLAKTQITRFSERSKRSELEQERCLRILNMKPLDGSIESQSELCQFFSNYHSIPLTQKESLSKSSEKAFETEKEGKDMLASRIKNDYANKLPQSSSGHHVSETSAQSMRFYEKTSSVAREKDSQYLESLIKVYNTPEKKNPWHTHNHTFQSDLPTTPASVANGFQLAWGGNSHPIGDIKTGLVDCNNGTHSLESTQPFELRVESYMNKMPEQKLNETIDESQVESLNLESPYLDNSDTLCNNVLIINSTKLSGDNNLLTSTDFNNVKDNGNIRQSAATAFDFCNQKTLNEFWKFHSS